MKFPISIQVSNLRNVRDIIDILSCFEPVLVSHRFIEQFTKRITSET